MNRLVPSSFLVAILLFSFSCQKEANISSNSTVPFISISNEDWADSLLSKLSLDQKIGQLLLLEPELLDTTTLVQVTQNGNIGGVLLENVPLLNHLDIIERLRSISPYPLFFASQQESLFNNQFSDVPHIINQDLINATQNDSLFQHLNQLGAKQAQILHINLNIGLPTNNMELQKQLTQQRTLFFNERRIISIGKNFEAYFPSLPDTSIRFQTLTKPIKKLVNQGIGGFSISRQFPIPNEETDQKFNTYFPQRLQYEGLILRSTNSPNLAIKHLKSGVDLLHIYTSKPLNFFQALKEAIKSGELSEEEIDPKVKKILMAKKWMHNGFDAPFLDPDKRSYYPIQASLSTRAAAKSLPLSKSMVYKHFIESKWEYFNYEISKAALTLLSNSKEQIPLKKIQGKSYRIIKYSDHSFRLFKNQFRKYANFQSRQGKSKGNGKLIPIIDGKTNYFNILLLDGERLRSDQDSLFLEGLAASNTKNNLIIINFGLPEALVALDSNYTVIQAYGLSDEIEELSAQLIFGGIAAQGKLPRKINQYWDSGAGHQSNQTRLAYAQAEEVGIRPEKLVGINAIANAAISARATPGCQVVVAKEGKIIFSQAFGHPSYRKKRRVNTNDIYDLASITKIASTALVSMQQYERGKFKINDRIKDHLPEYKKAPFKNTRVKDFLIHKTGIQPHLPVIPYLLYRGPKNTACDSFFCNKETEEYQYQIADNFYFKNIYRDTIWTLLNEVAIRKNRKYRYSDANMVIMQRLLETKAKKSLDQLAFQQFYYPLGLRRIGFRPLDKHKKDEIMPTEKDEKWRRQQIQGYVHDESAALLGGVAGHAGLFSNAEDLAVIMQMMLNKGSYGGKTYLKAETFDLFTEAKHGNHRGLGFDKPHSSNATGRAYEISSEAFGHTGFTGTCTWVDPKHDLVFVFLSNRIYTSKRNRKLFTERTRARIHQIVYDALDTYNQEWPDLELAPLLGQS